MSLPKQMRVCGFLSVSKSFFFSFLLSWVAAIYDFLLKNFDINFNTIGITACQPKGGKHIINETVSWQQVRQVTAAEIRARVAKTVQIHKNSNISQTFSGSCAALRVAFV